MGELGSCRRTGRASVRASHTTHPNTRRCRRGRVSDDLGRAMIDDGHHAPPSDAAGSRSVRTAEVPAIPTVASPPGRRLLARVARWQAPPRNLLLSALVLLVFPWDDILIDALYGGNAKLPTLVVYGVWSLFDFSVIWVLLASGQLVRPAFVYGGITVALDAMLAVVYLGLTQYTTAYIAATALLKAAYLGLITTVMWVRLSHGSGSTTWSGRWLGLGPRARTGGVDRSAQAPAGSESQVPPLFTFVAPLLVSIAVAYAATFFAGLTCAGHGAQHVCGAYGPPIGHSFFSEAAHILAILLVALAIEARLLVDRSGPEERALISITMLGLAVGIAASLTAAAANSDTLPLVFPLTVQALAIGITTTLMLPYLRFSP